MKNNLRKSESEFVFFRSWVVVVPEQIPDVNGRTVRYNLESKPSSTPRWHIIGLDPKLTFELHLLTSHQGTRWASRCLMGEWRTHTWDTRRQVMGLVWYWFIEEEKKWLYWLALYDTKLLIFKHKHWDADRTNNTHSCCHAYRMSSSLQKHQTTSHKCQTSVAFSRRNINCYRGSGVLHLWRDGPDSFWHENRCRQHTLLLICCPMLVTELKEPKRNDSQDDEHIKPLAPTPRSL